VFRADLLEGSRIAVAGGRLEPLELLGAELIELGAGLDEVAAQEWAAGAAPVQVLVCDARGTFAAQGLQPSIDWVWSVVRAVAVGAMIPGQDGGKILLVAPAADAGDHAEAVRAGLENLARTLSVEWARYRITVTAIAPGAQTSAEEVAQLVCFIASRAGDYFSGCRFSLGLV
jgi:NAD(P)-dependent dehydrogenase (short-subunit alcohol dehydrogenase family)